MKIKNEEKAYDTNTNCRICVIILRTCYHCHGIPISALHNSTDIVFLITRLFCFSISDC